MSPSSSLAESLRQTRAREFQNAAQDTRERKIPTSEICKRWSDFADRSLSLAFNEAHHRCPPGVKLGLFAYGKLGSRELNLSSDVDLVLVASDAHEKLSEWTRIFGRLLQDRTEHGFCFRLDFDLRPGGRMGPLIPTFSQFEDYFSNYGETWERLAFVRFRAICGDPSILENGLKLSQSFTYRKHLDFTLMEDLRDLRQRIHEQNWRRSQNGALDLKLGLGGIRDLELFVHTQQVIHGGRDATLRVASTQKALELLQDRKILEKDDAQFLITHYWELRHFENLLQAETDQQIQVLPTEQWLDLISASERERLRLEMSACEKLVSGLLGPIDPKLRSYPEAESEQIEWLSGLGYSPSAIERTWPELSRKSALSRQPVRDELYRKRFLSEMIQELAKFSENRDLSLELLNDFLKAIRAKATFFSLLLQKPELLQRLVSLFSSSSYLSGIMIQRPELLDSFLYQAHESSEDQDWDVFLSQLLERRLLLEMTAGLDFLKDQDLLSLLERLSQAADEIVQSLLERLNQEQGSEVEIIAMGKWGGREMGLRSDLDLVFITEEAPTENDFKTARRLISRLTEVHRGGALYQLDFRLKPQGKGGPLLTKKEDLLHYLAHEAAAWERQAYLKARPLRDVSFQKKIWQACISRPLTNDEWRELAEIRTALLQKAKNDFDLKYSAGGLIDCEFAAQLNRLAHLSFPISSSMLVELQDLAKKTPVWRQIHETYLELRSLEQVQLYHSNIKNLPHSIQFLLRKNAALLASLDPRLR